MSPLPPLPPHTEKSRSLSVNGILQEEDESATYKDTYLLISNRYDAPEEVAAVYVKRWRIGVSTKGCRDPVGESHQGKRSEPCSLNGTAKGN